MEATAEKQKPTEEAPEKEAVALTALAKGLLIQNDEDFTRADELLVSIATQKKDIASRFDPIIQKAHSAHKEALAQKVRLILPREQAETLIRARMVEYRDAKKVEADRLAAAAAVTGKAALEEERLYIADQLEQSGRGQEAEAVLSQPIVAPPPTASWSPVPPSRGTSFKETWKMRVVSLPDLVKAVADGKAPENLILANESALNGIAKALKASAKIPGVEFYKETGTSVRAR